MIFVLIFLLAAWLVVSACDSIVDRNQDVSHFMRTYTHKNYFYTSSGVLASKSIHSKTTRNCPLLFKSIWMFFEKICVIQNVSVDLARLTDDSFPLVSLIMIQISVQLMATG